MQKNTTGCRLIATPWWLPATGCRLDLSGPLDSFRFHVRRA